MNAIINLGNPLKNFAAIASAVVKKPVRRRLKITGARVFYSDKLSVTSGLYGAGMVQDCLTELLNEGLIHRHIRMILVGSMGSVSEDISLDDVVLPDPALCAYYDFEGCEVTQDQALRSALARVLKARGYKAMTYRHGSSYAVFDYHTDFKAYKSSLYDDVRGLDCGEVFMGMEFARKNDIRAGAVLYCSDSPKDHITEMTDQEFAERAARYDLLLNTAAAEILSSDV